MHALLVTSDDRVITEFQKIAAVTQTPLVIESEPNASDISNAYRVFVATDCAQANLNHPEIVLVVIGTTGPETWRFAAKLSANHIAVIPDSRDWLVEHLSAPVTKRGLCVAIIPGAGGTQRLPRLVGPSKAKELIFGGRMISADEALEIGLVNKVCAPDDVLAIALKWASQFVGGPKIALAAAKRAIDNGLDASLNTGLSIESTEFAALFATEDQSVGMNSFVNEGPGKAIFVGR